MAEFDLKFTPEEIAAVCLTLSGATENRNRAKSPGVRRQVVSFLAKAKNFKVLEGTAAVPVVDKTLYWSDPLDNQPVVDPIVLLERSK